MAKAPHRLLRFSRCGTLCASVFIIAIHWSAIAKAEGDAQRGAVVADQKCATCHAVALTGESKHVQAPPFRIVARKYRPDDLAEAFAEGIVVGHKDMPEFQLTIRQIDDLISYFKVLGGRTR